MDSSFQPSRQFLDQISTHWPQINNPTQFVLRYAAAIKRYLAAILRNSQEVDDACQDFLVQVFERGFQEETITRGRFRDYLKAAVRNAALTRLRRRLPPQSDPEQLAQLPDTSDLLRAADDAWNQDWRTSLLERVWAALAVYEESTPESLYHTVLRLTVDNPSADSTTLAGLVSARIGRPYRPDAFRKQVSRARRFFARLIVYEIRQTLDPPQPEYIEDELHDLNLMKYVRDYLPDDWRDRGEIDA